jgi:hypothetical protein
LFLYFFNALRLLRGLRLQFWSPTICNRSAVNRHLFTALPRACPAACGRLSYLAAAASNPSHPLIGVTMRCSGA